MLVLASFRCMGWMGYGWCVCVVMYRDIQRVRDLDRATGACVVMCRETERVRES